MQTQKLLLDHSPDARSTSNLLSAIKGNLYTSVSENRPRTRESHRCGRKGWEILTQHRSCPFPDSPAHSSQGRMELEGSHLDSCKAAPTKRRARKLQNYSYTPCSKTTHELNSRTPSSEREEAQTRNCLAFDSGSRTPCKDPHCVLPFVRPGRRRAGRPRHRLESLLTHPLLPCLLLPPLAATWDTLSASPK